MDFKLIKECNKKLNLWTGTVSFSFLIVALIIIFALTGVEIKIRTIIGGQFFANNLLIWLLIVCINLSPTMIRIFYRITNYRHPKTKNLEKSEFSLARWTHFGIFLLSLIIWFIEISGFMIQTKSWTLALKNYWWICLIMMIFNLSLLYLNFLMGQYLYNHQLKIQKQLNEN